MIKDSASLMELIEVLEKDQQEEFHNNGLHAVVTKFGTKVEDKTFLKTKLGNLMISEDPTKLTKIPLRMDLYKPVLLVGAFKWRIFEDNIEIHI